MRARIKASRSFFSLLSFSGKIVQLCYPGEMLVGPFRPVRIILSLRFREQKRQNLAHMKTTTLPSKHSMNQSPVRLAFLFISLALACFVLAPQARATCQKGCLTGSNTVLGEDALFSLATGGNTAAIGFKALFNDTDDTDNKASGTEALFSNTTGNYNPATGDFPLYNNLSGSYTQRPVRSRCITTHAAATTRPTGIERFRTQPATSTLHWASKLA